MTYMKVKLKNSDVLHLVREPGLRSWSVFVGKVWSESQCDRCECNLLCVALGPMPIVTYTIVMNVRML